MHILRYGRILNNPFSGCRFTAESASNNCENQLIFNEVATKTCSLLFELLYSLDKRDKAEKNS